MKKLLPLSVMCTALALGCGSNQDKPNDTLNPNGEVLGKPSPDPVVYSFVFVGCNRVQWNDETNKQATDASSADTFALRRIYRAIASENRKPDLFFFLGDMVTAEEQDTVKLHSELNGWLNLYRDTKFSSISTSGIELVAVPGNHECLYSYRNKLLPNGKHDPNYNKEFPEKGAIDIWMRYMSPFIPANADRVSGPDSMDNRATFAFVKNNIAFIVMNTDTYNDPAGNGLGQEGKTAVPWIKTKMAQYLADKSIQTIFVLGHKPYYVNNAANTGHDGFFDGPQIWPLLQNSKTVGMFSAHYHGYQRMQPGANGGPYQVIAGNGGSQLDQGNTFYGYSRVDVHQSGKVILVSKGFDCNTESTDYYVNKANSPFTCRDSTVLLTTAKNTDPVMCR